MSEPLSPWLQAWIDDAEPELDPTWMVIDSVFATQLTTTHERTFELAAANTSIGPELLTRELPNVHADQLDTLDERGLVRVGERVAPGSLLIGRATPRPGGEQSPEEKLLRAIFGELPSDVVDSSLRCPPGCFGVVIAAEQIEPGSEERARARVTIQWERPLALGDALLLDDGRRVIVASIASLGGDVAWRGGSGSIRLAKVSMAEDVIHGRSIGPYSDVTQRPLAGKEQFGGQLLTFEQAKRLAASAPWALWELCSIKSDSTAGRMRTYQSLVELENPAPREGELAELLPESLRVLTCELAALGLDVDFEAERVGVRLSSAEQLRERSRGRVLTGETIDYRTLAPEQGGLFCQRIFGPVSDYACACGKYKRMKYSGTTCEACGVEVTRSSVRRERFGHIELAAAVVHPLFVPEVARALGVSSTELRRVLAGKLGLDHDARPIAVDDELERTGAAVVRELLAERAPSASAFMLEVVPVLPPELRPLVPIEGGRFASSDLNDLYARVINRNNRIRRLIELAAPLTILRNDAFELQALVDTLFANEQRKKPSRGGGRVLRSLLGNVEVRFAELVAKHVDFSAVARLIADPSVPARGCKLPRRLAIELFRPIAYGLMHTHRELGIKQAKRALDAGQPFALEAIEQASSGFPVLLMGPSSVVARTVASLWDEPAIAVDPDTARRLAALDVTVHLPLTEQAQAECCALADDPAPIDLQPSGWLSAAIAEPKHALQRLRAAVLDGHTDVVTDPLLRAALGRPPAT